MQIVILAGGRGTRLAEETDVRPKPMVEIGGRPIIWHIMQHYSAYGFDDFYIALGYKGEIIKRYFLDYHMHHRNLLVIPHTNEVKFLDGADDKWRVNMIDTGDSTQTGGRLKRLQPFLNNSTFMLTYGDGVSSIDLNSLLEFHKQHGRIATISAVHPPARFGGLELDGNVVTSFFEKSQIREGWINGGYMVFEPTIFEYITDDATVLESDVLEQLAQEHQLCAYQHTGFWQCMDTLRDKQYLENLWSNGAPWKIW